MNHRDGIATTCRRPCLVLALATSLCAVAGFAGGPETGRPAQKAAGALAGISISYRLDPRLTGGLYMGDRWVSPPTFTSRGEKRREVTVDARAHGRDARGRATEIDPVWTADDPDMVTVTPGRGRAVTIAVHRPGRCRLTVASGSVSRQLTITATSTGTAIQVEISQEPPRPSEIGPDQ